MADVAEAGKEEAGGSSKAVPVSETDQLAGSFGG